MKTRLFTCCSLLLLSAFLCAASCGDQGLPQRSCEGVICTMQFTMVTVQVRDRDGHPAMLDSAVTVNLAGRVVARGAAGAGSNGIYTVVDDSYQKALSMRSEEVIFKGYMGGMAVVEQPFTISADCCHVSRTSGPDAVVIK